MVDFVNNLWQLFTRSALSLRLLLPVLVEEPYEIALKFIVSYLFQTHQQKKLFLSQSIVNFFIKQRSYYSYNSRIFIIYLRLVWSDLIIFCMQHPTEGKTTGNLQVHDPVSNKTFCLMDGALCVSSDAAQEPVCTYPIADSKKEEQQKHYPLKFKKIGNSSIIFAPSGRSVTSKSDKLTEVDMNIAYSEGTALWSICCSSCCLSLVVGIKNNITKKNHALEFTIQNATKISFKLDLVDYKFKAWVYKPLRTAEKVVSLAAEKLDWTPYIRFKGHGVAVHLSDLVQDPEKSLSLYNILSASSFKQLEHLELKEKPVGVAATYQSILKIDDNSLLLKDKKSVRLIRRDPKEKEFTLNSSFLDNESNYQLFFADEQVVILCRLGFDLRKTNGSYAGKQIQDWAIWMSSAFAFIDKLLKTGKQSTELCYRGFEILLSKIETFKQYVKSDIRMTPALESNLQACWGTYQSLLPIPKAPFGVRQTVRLNSEPGVEVMHEIKNVHWTRNFLVLQLEGNQRLVILNRESSLFKLGEVNLRKGFKKEYQLNEYQKEADLLQGINHNEPSIYKILKNCLKYADKVKIPEKEVKLPEIKKPQKKEKEKTEIKHKKVDTLTPDPSLVNTLIGMGFNEAQAKSALIEANNTLEKAIEIIFNQPQSSPKKSKKTSSSSDWSCEQCTLFNPSSSFVCSACQFPKPADIGIMASQKIEIEQLPMEEPKVMEETGDIQSKKIEVELNKVFVWELGFAYCPLLIAGAYQGGMRIRLYGPNPKYYSMFYSKDEQFVDLTHRTIHDRAYKIDQRPVRYQYFLTSTASQQKEAAYGWISIEDLDLELEGTVEDVKFSSYTIVDERIIFYIDVYGLKDGEKMARQFKIQINIDQIYAERKKCLFVEESHDKIKEPQPQSMHIQQKKILDGANIIPSSGYLQLSLARATGSQQKVATIQSEAVVSQKPHLTKNYLPVVAAIKEGSSQVQTLSTSLKQGHNPLVLGHLQKCRMIVESVVLEKVWKGPSTTSYKGHIYFSQDPNKQKLYKTSFELRKGEKKFVIETKQLSPCRYITIQIESNGEQQSNVIEQIAFVGITGEEVRSEDYSQHVKFSTLNRSMQINVRSALDNSQSSNFKVETFLVNFRSDLNVLSPVKLEDTLKGMIQNGTKMDIKVRIYGLEGTELLLKSFSLEGWNVIRKQVHWLGQNKIWSTEASYKSSLDKFINQFDLECLDQILQDENKDYLKIFVSENYNLTQFFSENLLSKNINKVNRRKISSFFQQIFPFLPQINKAGNFDYQTLLQKALSSTQVDKFALQLIFSATKSFPIEENLLCKDLKTRLQSILISEQKNAKDAKHDKNQNTLGKNKMAHFETAESIIYNRCVLQNGKLYRKYTLDLVNVYKVSEIALVFEKSTKKSAFNVIVKSFGYDMSSKVELEQFYPEYVWDQVAVYPFSEEFQKVIKENKRSGRFNCMHLPLRGTFEARFLQIQISFAGNANIGVSKDLQKIPQSEVLIEVYGDYSGQSQSSLGIFQKLDVGSLTFIKAVGNVSKFNVRSQNNTYYYDLEQLQGAADFQEKNNLPSNEKVNKLIANYEIDQLLAKGSDNLTHETVIQFLHAVSELGKSQLLQKILYLLKKVAKTNLQLSSFIFSKKLPSEQIFNFIFKESVLKVGDIVKVLSSSPTQVQVENAVLFAKNRQQQSCKQLFNKILTHLLKAGNIGLSRVLHQKYGWVSQTVTALDEAVRFNKTQQFQHLLALCKNHHELIRYCQDLLSRSGVDYWFSVAFEQLINWETKLKDDETSKLFTNVIDKIMDKFTSDNDEDETQLLENFNLVMKGINKLQIKQKGTLNCFLQLFSRMPQKQTLLGKILQIKQLKSHQFTAKFIELSLKMLNGYLQSANKPYEWLSQVHEIFISIFRNEGNNHWASAVDTQTLNASSEVFSASLISEVTLVSEEATKILDSGRRFRLATVYCLAIIISKVILDKANAEQQLSLSEKSVKNLLRWAFASCSLSHEVSQASNSHFSVIEQTVWNLLTLAYFKDSKRTTSLFKQEFSRQQTEIAKMRSNVHRKIFQKKLLNSSIRFLKSVQLKDNSFELLQNTFDRFLTRVAAKKTAELQNQMQEKYISNPLEERQEANNFDFEYETANKPKDWLVYMNGAKNSVFKFEYPKTAQGQYEIVLRIKENKPINLSKILIGFEQIESGQESYCNPREVTVEGGSKLEELKFIGKMTEIPDSHYINYSVRVFALNCSQVQLSKLSSSVNKYPDVKYLKITFKTPDTSSVADSLGVPTNKTKNYGSSINFMSIKGYSASTGADPEISSIVKFTEIVSAFTFKESLRRLFDNPAFISIFKQSLINLSIVMRHELYSKPINRFIMRICEVNTQIGNETIEKYLSTKNSQTCAKVVSEVILSNQQSLQPRILIFHQFIARYLRQNQQSLCLRAIEPFLNKFCQVVFIVENQEESKKDRIELQFDVDVLCLLVKNSKSIEFLKYLTMVMRLQAPFVSRNLEYTNVLKQLSSAESALAKQVLYSLVITDKNSRVWFMQNNFLERLQQQIMSAIKQKPEDVTQLKNNLEALGSLCFNSNIKNLINKSRFNMDVFSMLVSSEYSHLLVGEKNTSLRETFVNFITRSVLGSENQRVVAQALKAALTSTSIDQNKFFVGQVFLPILNSYSKLTICIHPYEAEEKKILPNISLRNDNSSGSKDYGNKKAQSKFRLPTYLLDNNTKAQLYGKIKESSSIAGGHFNLRLSHGNDAYGKFQSISQFLFNSNKPILFLFKTVNKSKKIETVGILHQTKSQPRGPIFSWNQNSLLFVVKEDGSVEFIELAGQKNKQFARITSEVNFQEQEFSADEMGESSLAFYYDSVEFCAVYSSIMLGSSYLDLGVLRKSNNRIRQVIESVQYWTLEPVTVKQNTKASKQPSLVEEILSMYDFNLFESQFETLNVLRFLRYDKIYEFPSSLSVRELKLAVEVMKCKLKQGKESDLHLYTIDQVAISDETAVKSLNKKDEQSPITDVLCSVNNISEILNYNSTANSTPTAYLPKRGIMKHFEEINGVSSMISVILKSLEGWKNKDRREKWSQYVLELQKFSSFPHFFGMYMKDSETFDLLFKLLSGEPDNDQDKKWDELETKATQKLLKIVAEILSVDKTTEFRQYAMKHDFFKTILERLRILTGQFKRQWKQEMEKDEEQSSPSKVVDDDGTKQIKKKKGVGYGNEGSSNTKWMKGTNPADLVKQFEVTEIILNIIENFLDLKQWNVPKKVLDNIFQSALLPYLEDSLRAGTLLQISKHPDRFKLVFKMLRTICKNSHLVQTLMPVSKNYQPRQTQSIQSLLKSLESTANIFLSCLKTSKQSTAADKVSEDLAIDIIETSKLVEEGVEQYIELHQDDTNNEAEMQHILELPLDKKYRTLLKDLRFDYIDMKEGSKIKHHYSSNFQANYTPNQTKMIRLAQELADISTALPYEHTNAIFVRCDKDRVDFMQALIMGSNGTPYGHGAYLFDVYFDDTYPNSPPKVNLTTTGHGKVRFNPNLYACGKVCLSLLGTWRGSASQNWDAKVSTLLQVLVSIQAIIMSEEVYFNEPGFEGQQGTVEGDKKNEAYSNIVRYCNIKFAMVENMKNPPKGFEHVIKRHFYLKQHQIMQECKKWLLYAQKRPANYVGLVNDHNNSWSTEFKKSKSQYKDMLQKAIQQLQEEFKKLPVPSINDIANRSTQKKNKKKKAANTDLLKKLEDEVKEQIDVAYDQKSNENGKQIDINDEKVKDRWSRYIGAMGIDAVSKQSKADILVFGIGPAALEVVKNLVLSGCRKLTIVDDRPVRWEDLSGGFFFTEADVGKNRVESILYKIRELNIYVKVDTLSSKDVTEQVLKTYNLLFVTEMSLKQQFKLNQQCRVHNVKFISADFRGAHCRLFNDFGNNFEVLDKNGQQPVEVMIKSITSAANGLVTLLDGAKHPYEDGEVVLIKNVEGMAHKQDKTKSINGTLHKVKVINSKSFEIGDTTIYEPYVRNGIAKNVKTPVFLKYKPMAQVYDNIKEKMPIDDNLQFYDFSKMARNTLIHNCFVTLDAFVESKGKMPTPWSANDAGQFVEIFKKVNGEETTEQNIKYVRRFSFTCSGYLPPLGAYFGGFISQEVIKAITQKFKPLDAVFYMDAEEIIPAISEDTKQSLAQTLTEKQHRDRGFEIVVGRELLELIKNSTSFMIGSGAIGCELLKNFAMIGLGTGEKGKITLTDPDHIENSNLNRQFLFREKHISKPKSRTAAASVLNMNPYLKGHISALLERVSQTTKNIFSNKFFESLTFVANALDNVAARRYVDQRCVQNKIPLFQSGTLGPKGHTQVIIPFKTESYGSQNDPVEEGEIPHCTLKMFPEETLHCVEWARDIFGKKFSLQPKAFIKVKDTKFKPQKDDIKSLNECLVMANNGPKSFQDCIAYAIKKFYKYFRDDIMQLLYTYPLDAKTKDGEPFWKLPKRPPTPILQFDPENILHCTFVASMAVLVAKVYKVPYPKNFREQKQRKALGLQASKIKVPEFVASDEKAKSILKQIADEKKDKNAQEQQAQKQIDKASDKDELQLHSQFVKNAVDMQVEAEQFEKDNDQNGHIDFIYAMANLRATNYKLDGMDWITTKLKAGRIVPALATTTTCVAGLQTLEICKYIRKLKLEDMRNSFLNLAVPSLQMSQPGQVKKLKLTDKLQVNLWDRWVVPCTETTTFAQVYQFLQAKYELNPIGMIQGMSRIDTAKSEAEKKQFLESKLVDRLDKEDNFIDVVVLFTRNSQEEKMLENVPPVRLVFGSESTA